MCNLLDMLVSWFFIHIVHFWFNFTLKYLKLYNLHKILYNSLHIIKYSYIIIFGCRPLVQINLVHLLVTGVSSVSAWFLSLCMFHCSSYLVIYVRVFFCEWMLSSTYLLTSQLIVHISVYNSTESFLTYGVLYLSEMN
jgi:hypothetical protein